MEVALAHRYHDDMRYACAWLLLLAVACGDDDDGSGPPVRDGSNGGTSSGAPGRGSAACNDWQDAICDFASGECRVIGRAECDDNYKAVTCASDERASACSNAFNSATCMTPPPSCDLTDIADPAPARAACDQLLTRLCGHVLECGMVASLEECRQQVDTAIDCDRAVAHSPGFDACLAQVETLPCSMLVLPDLCRDVIKIGP
jgi:hypothetical protein